MVVSRRINISHPANNFNIFAITPSLRLTYSIAWQMFFNRHDLPSNPWLQPHLTFYPPLFYPYVQPERKVFESTLDFSIRIERRDERGKETRGRGEEGQGERLRKPSEWCGIGWSCGNLWPEIHPFSIFQGRGNFLGCTSTIHRDGHGSIIHGLLNYLLPLVYDLGGLVNVVDGPDEPGNLGPAWK